MFKLITYNTTPKFDGEFLYRTEFRSDYQHTIPYSLCAPLQMALPGLQRVTFYKQFWEIKHMQFVFFCLYVEM